MSAVLLCAAGLASLAGLLYFMHRSLLYPAVALCAVWAAGLAGLLFAGNLFFPVSERSLMLVILGTLAFVVGAAVAHPLAEPRRAVEPPQVRRVVPGRFLDGLLLLLIVGMPFYLLRVRAMLAEAGVEGLLYGLRVQTLRAAEDPFALGIGSIGNLVPLSAIATLLAFREPRETRWERIRAGVILLFALSYGILTGGRASALSLMLALGALVAFRPGKIPRATLTAAFVGFVSVFVILAVFVRKGRASPDATLAENVVAIAENFQIYALGGIVALNRVVDEPGSLPSTGGVFRTAKEIANRFGAQFEIPSLHAQWTTIGNGLQTNVYTTYFVYYQDGGVLGSMLLMGLLGVITTIAYIRARAGGEDARVYAAVFFAGTLQSVFNEPFYTNINYLGKLTVALLVVRLIQPSTAAALGSASRQPANLPQVRPS